MTTTAKEIAEISQQWRKFNPRMQGVIYGLAVEMADLISQQAAEIVRLKNEVEILRLYGNKDCTAMADEVIASWEGPGAEQQ